MLGAVSNGISRFPWFDLRVGKRRKEGGRKDHPGRSSDPPNTPPMGRWECV